MKRIFVTGGAGYIGSHIAKALAHAGFEPVVLDNLLYGHLEAVKWGPFEKIDLRDDLEPLFRKYQPEALIHCAALTYVGESVEKPLLYYENNVAGTINLLQTLLKTGPIPLVFSSTCAIYGNPLSLPIDENHPQNPISPYGRTKLMVETILADCRLPYVALRYFNAAGADGEIGEDHTPETHLMPLVIKAALTGKPLKIFGDDYDTPDGTAIRDYVHVNDLADAHIKALFKGPLALNLGTGHGYSVKEIIAAVEKESGLTVPFTLAPRRPGDPARLVADARQARRVLGWEPRYTLSDIVRTAYQWHKKQFS